MNNTINTDIDSHQDYLDARRAQSLAAWSYIGLIIPLLGWILAGQPLSIVKTLPEHGKIGKIKWSARRNSVISILLSLIIVIIYIVAIINASNAAKQRQAEFTAQSNQQQAIQNCINEAHKFFDWQIASASNSYSGGSLEKSLLEQRIAACQTNPN